MIRNDHKLPVVCHSCLTCLEIEIFFVNKNTQVHKLLQFCHLSLLLHIHCVKFLVVCVVRILVFTIARSVVIHSLATIKKLYFSLDSHNLYTSL